MAQRNIGGDKSTSHHARLPSGPIGRLLASVGNMSCLLNAIHSRFAQERGLGTRGIWTLSAISEGNVTPGAIARLMMLPPSVVSGDLKELVQAGLIERCRDDSDGRRLIYSLTLAGQNMLSAAHRAYVDLLGEKIASYPAGEIDRMLRIFYDLTIHVRLAVEAAEQTN